jgi:hypothetical protein
MTTAAATTRGRTLLGAAGRGALAGIAGVAAMTIAEKAEQQVTQRPNSYIPARVLLTLFGRRPSERAKPLVWNHAMHWGTGTLVGALRGVWAVTGLRGPQAHFAHTIVRLATDQTLENATGVGAPPSTWPRKEQLIDYAHKGIYAVVTGVVAERMIKPRLVSTAGSQSH